MKIFVIVLSVATVLAVPVIGAAQQLKQAQKVAPFQSIDKSNGSSSTRARAAPQSARKTSVRSDASQRDSSPSVGIAMPSETTSAAKQSSTQTKQASASTHVTDPRGQIVNGAVQVSPNQVMDPKTGRVYPTAPVGDGQRIIGPVKK